VGAADDIKRGLTKNLPNFTKQRKAEEKHSYAGRWRRSRMTEVRGMYLTEAANDVGRDPPRLVAGEQLGRVTSAGLVLAGPPQNPATQPGIL